MSQHTAAPLPSAAPKNWLAGAARAGAACLAAVAFCASGATLGDPPLPSSTVSPVAISTGEQAAGSELGQQLGIPFGAPASVGQALRSRLMSYPGLPKAKIAMLAPAKIDKNTPSSTSHFNMQTGECEIALVVDPKGYLGVASTMRSMMGLSPSAGLAQRLGDFEALHELGHCASHLGKIGFSHPALSPEENKALTVAMAGSSMEGIWAESFADAYAMLQTFERNPPGSAGFSRAARDAEIIENWRKMDRDRGSRQTEMGLKAGTDDPHLTEKTIEELRSRLDYWLDSSTSIEARAAQLASIGTFRAQKTTDESDATVIESLQLRSRLEEGMIKIATTIAPQALILSALTKPADSLELTIAGAISDIALPDSHMSIKLLASNAFPLAKIIDSQARKLVENPLLDNKDLAEFPKLVLAQARSSGLMDKMLSQAPASYAKTELLARSAWIKGQSTESATPSTLLPAHAAAFKIGQLAEALGEGKLDKSFYNSIPQTSKIEAWRKKRQPPSSSTSTLEPNDPKSGQAPDAKPGPRTPTL